MIFSGRSIDYTYDRDGLPTQIGDFSISRNPANGLPEAVTVYLPPTYSAVTPSGAPKALAGDPVYHRMVVSARADEKVASDATPPKLLLAGEASTTSTTVQPESLAITGPASINAGSTTGWGVRRPLTASRVTSNQTVTINASYTDENGYTVTASMDVVIVAPDSPALPASLSVYGASSVAAGATSNYTATLVYSDGSSKAVDAAFSLYPTTAATMTSSGVLNAGAGSADQYVLINASYTENGITARGTLRVTIVPGATSLIITGPSSLSAGSNESYYAIATFSNGQQQVVPATFSLSPTSAATISQNGILAANQVSSDQSVTISASFSGATSCRRSPPPALPYPPPQAETGGADNGPAVTASMNVVIVAPGSPALPAGLAVNGANKVGAGASSNYAATVTYSDGSSKKVDAMFSLSPTTAATMTSNGQLSAGADGAGQGITVNAIYTEGGVTVSGALGVTINPPLRGLTIQGPSSVRAGGAAGYWAIASYNDDSTSYVNPTFTLDSTTAATITSSGTFSAANIIGANQTVTLNASYSEGGTPVNASLTVQVVVVSTTGLTIRGPASVDAGAAATYTATAFYSDGSSKVVDAAFTLDSTTAATISASGALSAAAIPTDQTVTVNASHTEGGVTRTASKTVQIAGRILPVGLTIQGPATVNRGSFWNYSALATYDDGTFKTVNATFSLGTTSAAIMSSEGVLNTGEVAAEDTITIDASYTESGFTVSTTMNVAIRVQGALSLNRGFDGFGQVDSEQTEISGQNIYSYALTRNSGGEIVSRTETIGQMSLKYDYTYDSLGRLASVALNGVVVEQYQYGANGTRTSESSSLRGISNASFSYSQEDNLVTAGSATYAYDADGFLSSKTVGSLVTRYTYSTLGELLGVTFPNGTVIHYTYDPLGRRIAREVNGAVVQKYLWQGRTNRILAVYDANDNPIMVFLYADGRLPLAMTAGGVNYYLCYDQVGTLRVVTDTSGAIVKQINYDSFGNVISDSNPSFAVPFGFAGGLYDPDTGLVHFGARDYDPGTGMWTAKDPILFRSGSSNLYGHVQNDPINLIDPEGLADNWYGYNDKNFQDWAHAEKQDIGQADNQNFSKDQVKELYDEWIEQGSPRGKGGKSSRGGKPRICPPSFDPNDLCALYPWLIPDFVAKLLENPGVSPNSLFDPVSGKHAI